MIVSFLKIIISSAIMGFIARNSYILISTRSSSELSLMLAILIGAISYLIIIYLMKIPEVENLIKIKKGTI